MFPTSEAREPESPKPNRFGALFSWVASTLHLLTRTTAATFDPQQSSINLAQIHSHEHDHLQDQNQLLGSYLLLSDNTTGQVTANPPPLLMQTDSIPAYPPLQLSLSERFESSSVSSFSSSSSAIFDRDESIPSAPNSPNYLKIQTIEPARVQLPAMEAEAEPLHPVVEIIDRLELGKSALVLAIAMLMGLIAIYNNTRSVDTGMFTVALMLSCAFPAILNGVLLRNSYPTISIVILVVGLSLVLFALFAYLGWILSIKLAAIPILSFLLSLFPFYLVIRSLICTKKMMDLEMGEIHEPT